MEDVALPERRPPRSQEEIFADLRALAQSDGALHEISTIVYRDWLVGYDIKEGRVTNDPEHRWSVKKLNKNELMLLVGLLVQNSNDRTYSVVVSESDFIERGDALLAEFHDLLMGPIIAAFDLESKSYIRTDDSIGPYAREAIYYGAESFYQHQFSKFSRLRYREDSTWLLQNAGLSVRPLIDIAKYIADRINAQMSALLAARSQGHALTKDDLTTSLLVSKADLRKKFGGKSEAFTAKFATLAWGSNLGFVDPFAINEALIAPLVDLGEFLFVPSQYRLYESIYESPFYWMWEDKSYRSTLSDHRGAFLEKSIAYILRAVFGEKHVHENVIIKDGSKNRAGEIDVLVLYGEFILVVQAKSKRVTLKARAGDIEALKKDFEGAIQDPYAQALKCAQLIRSGADCITGDGTVLKLPRLPRVFPVIALSDPFPSSTFLSRNMLVKEDNLAPVIWDLGVLDCVARVLASPIDLLFYLQCRAKVFDTIISDSEYNFLGYHLLGKLALAPEADFMMLERDFASPVDDFMIAADVGVEVERPKGILERITIPIVSELLAELKYGDPRLAGVVVDLYDFSSAALKDISDIIVRLREEVSRTGKAIKAFSIPTSTGGFTYAVVSHLADAVRKSAERIGRKYKYDNRSDRWYVIVDSIETEGAIDGLLALVFPWVEDEDEAANSARVASIFGSRQEAATVGGQQGMKSKVSEGRKE